MTKAATLFRGGCLFLLREVRCKNRKCRQKMVFKIQSAGGMIESKFLEKWKYSGSLSCKSGEKY
jgi:hypothetical protein